jgi:hypothetical protein
VLRCLLCFLLAALVADGRAERPAGCALLSAAGFLMKR